MQGLVDYGKNVLLRVLESFEDLNRETLKASLGCCVQVEEANKLRGSKTSLNSH